MVVESFCWVHICPSAETMVALIFRSKQVETRRNRSKLSFARGNGLRFLQDLIERKRTKWT